MKKTIKKILIGVVSVYTYNRIMIVVTQGVLRDFRDDLFEHMEKLPIKYFDTHAHGDIMSIYTNDIDTLRQMVSQSIPQVINSAFTIVSIVSIVLRMMYRERHLPQMKFVRLRWNFIEEIISRVFF